MNRKSAGIVFGLVALSAVASPKEQGSSLHGSRLSAFRVLFAGVTRDGLPVEVNLVKGSLLDFTKNPSALTNAIFTGITSDGTSVRLTIQSVQSHLNPYRPLYSCSSPSEDSEYEVSYTIGSGARKMLCGDDPKARAIAVAGSWNAKGDRSDNPNSFTFACVDRGVIAKCFDWCYKPYLGLEREHHSCTRMARADYCGDGSSNTVFDTFVDSWDVRGVNATDCVSGNPPPWRAQTGSNLCTNQLEYSPMSFEAAWRVNSSAPREAAAVCLSKKRWQTMPLRGNCNLRLQDPRTGNDGRYCDEMTVAQMRALGATHFNYSSFYDVGLWSFSNGSDMYSSSRTAEGRVPPPDVTNAYDPESYEGAIWHPLREPANGLALYTYTKGGDHWTTSAPPSEPGWTRRNQPEGWVVDPAADKPAPTARKLYCYVRGADHFTTSRPAEAENAGFSRCARYVEGWMPY